MHATVPTQSASKARGGLHCLHTGRVIGESISFEDSLIHNTVKYKDTKYKFKEEVPA